MCDQKSTHITSYLNHFCDIKIRLKHKIRIFQNLDFEKKNRFLQNLYKYKNIESTPRGVNKCKANLMTDVELRTKCNTLSVIKECSRIPDEGLSTISSKFL